MESGKLKNWAGNLSYGASEIYRPESVGEIQELVAQHSKIRALGTRHCFNRIADTPHALISTERLHEIYEIDPKRMTATIGPAVTYGALSPRLEAQGLALPNLASLPHISVVGACVTATHGSGVANQNLASSVSSFQTVIGDGSLRAFSKTADPELFKGLLVNLGAAGIITRITLDLIPTFRIQQEVFEDLPWDRLTREFDEILSGAYSVSLFLDWQSDRVNQVWVKRKLESEADLTKLDDYFGAKPAERKLHPLPDMSAEFCTEQLGVPGPWFERLPHFKMEFTPSSGEELQSEFFVPRRDAIAALEAVKELSNEIAPLLFISEIRTVSKDDLWLSPQFQRDCVGIHFTWKLMEAEVMALLPKVEARLAQFEARPHWGKIFTTPVSQSNYPKLADFKDAVHELDPEKKFINPFLSTIVS